MKRNIQILKDLDHISRAAAEIWVNTAARATAERGRYLVALSGGNTPAGLHKLLAEPASRDQVDWRATHVFWGDERCVSKDDPGNSYSQARDDLLSLVAIPDENVHRVASDLEPESAAREYARVLKDFAGLDEAGNPLEWPRFDLIVLGMGDDGHTASLFPG
ncbi:MAG TPA: 6-phosphogluconolactonase, partial [Anaerolineales bacterium]